MNFEETFAVLYAHSAVKDTKLIANNDICSFKNQIYAQKTAQYDTCHFSDTNLAAFEESATRQC